MVVPPGNDGNVKESYGNKKLDRTVTKSPDRTKRVKRRKPERGVSRRKGGEKRKKRIKAEEGDG
jgi:hypothetical protein